MCEDSLCSHLQRVGLGEVCEPAHSHGDPDVHHLGSDVAQRKVADHHFLRHGGVCQTGVMDGRERCPHNLGGREGEGQCNNAQNELTQAEKVPLGRTAEDILASLQ